MLAIATLVGGKGVVEAKQYWLMDRADSSFPMPQ
jgi:hypothetical protein